MADRAASEGPSSSDDGALEGWSGAGNGGRRRDSGAAGDLTEGRPASYVCVSESDTLRLGQSLGKVLKGGDVVFTEGPLGVGKTCLIRGICSGLGFEGRVRSPSFAVVNQYDGKVKIYHVDLYRIPSDSPELEDLSRQEYFSDDVVTLVEWGEKLVSWGVVPSLRIQIQIVEGEHRQIDIEATDPEMAKRVSALKSK